MNVSKEKVDGLLDRIGIRGMADELLPLPDGVFDLSADNPALKEHIVTVYPRTLEDVRLLVGTSLEDGEKNKDNMNLPEAMQAACEKAAVDGKAKGDDASYNDLYQIANEILHFPTRETQERIETNEWYQKARDEILNAAKAVPVLVAQDLVVKDGETYRIGMNSAVFNSITIYGSGQIVFTKDQVKLTTNSFKYEPGSKGDK